MEFPTLLHYVSSGTVMSKIGFPISFPKQMIDLLDPVYAIFFSWFI